MGIHGLFGCQPLGDDKCFEPPTPISMADQSSSTAANKLKKKGADMVKRLQGLFKRPKPVNDSASQSKFPVATAEVAALTLANICLDVQIGICMFLQPSDILALRKVCRHRKFSSPKSVKYYYQDL